MRLLLLNGSLRAGSVNGTVLRTLREVAPPGLNAALYEGMAALPHFNPDADTEPLPRAVVQLRGAVAGADAVLICTPEYAGALPGAFKNLLDWLVGSAVMSGKPTAWVNVSTNVTGARDAHASLRVVLRYLDAAVLDSACVHLPVARAKLTEEGQLDDPVVRDELRSVLLALQATGTAAGMAEPGQGG